MLKFLLLSVVGALLLGSCDAQAQARPAASFAYMQIFYEGAGWLADRPLLHYSPAFRGKTDELVREDSTARIAPGAYLFNIPTGTGVSIETGVTTTPDNGVSTTYVRGQDSKMRPQTPTEAQRAQTREKARFDRQLNLAAARGALARNTLTNALNAAAADGWEVVQVAPWGSKDGLMYLLRRH